MAARRWLELRSASAASSLSGVLVPAIRRQRRDVSSRCRRKPLELPPGFRTPGMRSATAPRKDVVSCLLLTRPSSASARSSWPGLGTNRSPLAKELGISKSCLDNWVAQAEADDAGGGSAPADQRRERRNRPSCATVTVSLKWRTRSPGRWPICPGERPPKVTFRLARELADDRIDVTFACRVLGVARSGYQEWKDRLAPAREQDNEMLLQQIEKIHADPRAKRRDRARCTPI